MTAMRHMAYYSAVLIGTKGLSLLMLPVVTGFVAIADYGVLNLLTNFASMAGILLSLGLAETLFRFASSRDQDANKNMLRFCFTVSCIGILLFGICLLISSHYLVENFPFEVKNYQIQLIITNLCFASLLTVPFAYWRLSNQTKKYCIFVLGQGVTQAALTLLFLYLGLGIDAVLISGALASTSFAVAGAWQFKDMFSINSMRLFKQVGQFALFVMLAAICLFFIQGAEQWIIASYLSATVLATYYISAQLSLLVSFSIEPFKQWWFARRYKAMDDRFINNPYFSVLGCELATLANLILLALVPLFLPYILSNDYLASLEWLHWVCLIATIKLHADFLNFGCYVKFNGKVPLIINAISAVCMICSALLWVQSNGLIGVLQALLTANILRTGLFVAVSQCLLFQEYNKTHLLCAWLFLGIGFYVTEHQSEYSQVLITALYSILLVILHRKQIRKMLTFGVDHYA